MSTGARVAVEGFVERPLDLGFGELSDLPDQVLDVGERLAGRRGVAVTLAAILEAAGVRAGAATLTVESADRSYRGTIPLEEAAEALVVYRLGDGPLPEGDGGPVRFFLHDAETCRGHGDRPCLNVKDLGLLRVG